MKIKKLANGAIVVVPKIFEDERGYFFESFNEEQFNKETGMDFHPVQDNESESCAGVFRGLHFQKPPYDQAKLVRVVKGMAVDFAVDIRKGSPTYGKWTMCILDDCNHTQFFIPKGFAHGFLALQDDTVFQYKCDNYYNKESEGAITFEDKELKCCDERVASVNQEFTLEKYLSMLAKGRPFNNIILSNKDKNNKKLDEIDNPFVYRKQMSDLRTLALDSEEYKNSGYKIGDRVHVMETDYDAVFEFDCTIDDVMLVYNPSDLTPIIAWIVRLDNGLKRKIEGLKSIQYKITTDCVL